MPPRLSNLTGSPAARILSQLRSGLDPRSWQASNPTEALARGFQSLRSGLFMAESLPVFWLQRPAGQAQPPPPPAALEATLTRLQELFDRDAEQIGDGLVPLSVRAKCCNSVKAYLTSACLSKATISWTPYRASMP